jgi:hypothetical protein
MADPLALYLNDHLAGARFAIELLDRLRESYSNEPLGLLAGQLLTDIDEDRAVLQKLADQVGTGGSSVKEAASWLVEKASRLKLQLNSATDLGTFEAVETLSLGVLGKLKLWQALLAVQSSDARLQQLDFNTLSVRAESQHDKLEQFRVRLAKSVLAVTTRKSD